MAVAQHNLTRRALLGAVCAAPAFHRHPGLDPGSTFFSAGEGQGRWTHDRDASGTVRGTVPPDHQVRGDEKRTVTNWDRALSRYRRAEVALEAVKGSLDDHLHDRLLGRLLKALARLLRTPAPHLPALAEKLDLLVAHQVWELKIAEAALAALQREGRGLASTRSS